MNNPAHTMIRARESECFKSTRRCKHVSGFRKRALFRGFPSDGNVTKHVDELLQAREST